MTIIRFRVYFLRCNAWIKIIIVFVKVQLKALLIIFLADLSLSAHWNKERCHKLALTVYNFFSILQSHSFKLRSRKFVPSDAIIDNICTTRLTIKCDMSGFYNYFVQILERILRFFVFKNMLLKPNNWRWWGSSCSWRLQKRRKYTEIEMSLCILVSR